MPFVHSITATPPPRFDGDPWVQVRIEDSADNVAWAEAETQALAVVDADPAHPAKRDLTTALSAVASGWMRVVWIDATGGESPPSEGARVPGTGDDGYPSLEALLAASASEELGALDVSQQVALRSSAISAVEWFTRQTFTQEGTSAAPVTKSIDGTDDDTLYVPKRLVSVTALTIDGQLMNADDYGLADEHTHLAMVDGLDAGSWVTRVRRSPLDPGPVFNRGRRNIGVSGVWGWTADEWATGLLDSVAAAIRFDMEDQASAEASRLAPTVRSVRALGLAEISQGNLSAALNGSEPTLSMRAQRKLIGQAADGSPLRWALPVAATA